MFYDFALLSLFGCVTSDQNGFWSLIGCSFFILQPERRGPIVCTHCNKVALLILLVLIFGSKGEKSSKSWIKWAVANSTVSTPQFSLAIFKPLSWGPNLSSYTLSQAAIYLSPTFKAELFLAVSLKVTSNITPSTLHGPRRLLGWQLSIFFRFRLSLSLAVSLCLSQVLNAGSVALVPSTFFGWAPLWRLHALSVTKGGFGKKISLPLICLISLSHTSPVHAEDVDLRPCSDPRL